MSVSPSGIRRPEGLSGARGLILAIMALAVQDLTGINGERNEESARRYFAGDVYRIHMRMIGLPDGWLPEALE